jgi:O-glycosyl hydrolase
MFDPVNVTGNRIPRPRLSTWAAGTAVATVVLALLPVTAAHAATSITINGTATGRRFDGVGAISGGGGTSRLLPDYPVQQQSEILDYLFKPNVGANVQILKVEIGGDTNSTNGAEASHMRTATDLNCNRGYEWWLMQQAKARNPNVKLAGLAWGAPGWLGSFTSTDTINYLIKWIGCAQQHGLTIDYIGGQNEAGYDKSWLEQFKSALKANNLSTQLIGGDEIGEAWGIVDDMNSDATLRGAVDIAGVHYPCQNDGGPADNCLPPSGTNPAGLSKPVWASEHGSQNLDTGAPALARALNRDYIDARITALLHWNLVDATYPTLPDPGDSLMQANTPWSGAYRLGKQLWVMAHTAQFAQPGWQYLDSATGYLGGNRNNGSYVALKSPNGRDYSTIVETTRATAAQPVTFTVTGGLSTGAVHVWATNLNSSNQSDFFVHTTDVTPSGGSYTVTLQPGYVYSLTTATGQGKDVTTPPPPAGLAIPYADNFDSYPAGSLAHYFADDAGGFDTAPCANGHTGMCYRQEIATAPIEWPIGSSSPPVTVVGDPNWTNYQVKVDADLQQAGTADLIGRSEGVSQFGPGGSQGYHFRIDSSGSWRLFKEDGDANDTTLASGSRTIGTGTWHTLTLNLNSTNIQASIDGTQVASVTDSTYHNGQVGLLVSKWHNAMFDNFAVDAPGGPGGPSISSIDDSQFSYSGTGWQHCAPCGDTNLFNDSNSWDNVAGDSATVSFTGTQVAFYGVLDPQHGIGAVSVDGGKETNLDFYSATRAGDHLMWTSPVLTNGAHTFKLRVTGTKNASSTGTYVVPDRVDVTAGSSPPPPPPNVTTVDDPALGYTGAGWRHCSGCGADLYNGTNSWDNTTGDSATYAFAGTRIALYGVLDPQHGIGAVSVDGGAESTIDFYSASRSGNHLMWTSPVLTAGAHTFKLRVTGTKNASSSNTFVVPDRVDVTA